MIVLLLTGCTSCSRYEGPVRHVVFISLDTARADHFGCYGNTWIHTPEIDALADESILFTDFMTVAPSTLASHTSLFTGKYPHTHGVPRNGFMVNRENVMLTEILKEQGFHTAGFIASFALESRFDFAEGFDHYDETFDFDPAEGAASTNQRRAAAVNEAVIAYLEKTGIPRHLFLFVHYFDPHAPYDPPPPYDTMYDTREIAVLPGSRVKETGINTPVAQESPGEEAGLSRREELLEMPNPGELLSRYAGEISYMDREVGRLLDYLKASGILDEAILVLTSDHGENLGEHDGQFDHGLTTYQTEMDAVCLIRLPGGMHGGTRVRQLLANIDILPTLLEYLGLPAPTGMEGEPFDLDNPGAVFPARIRFGQATKPWKTVETNPKWYNLYKMRCIRSGEFKFTQTPHQDTEGLYDLSADYAEVFNLLDYPGLKTELDSAKISADLRRRLETWAGFSPNPLPSVFEPSQRAETTQKLKALGYLE